MKTTLAQAVNRSNGGHRRVLEVVSATGMIQGVPGEAVWSLRGLAKAGETLRKWGAIEEVTPGRYSPNGSTPATYRLTDFGSALKASLPATPGTPKETP